MSGKSAREAGPESPGELTDEQKIRRLPWFYGHNVCNSIFCQLTFFGPVFVLFLSELGLPKIQIGFLLSLLPFCGLLALFIAPAVARAGVKRVFLIGWAGRKGAAIFLLPVPWILGRYGQEAAFGLVVVSVVLFALFRAVAETAWYPWSQEIVPPSVRGRFGGINHVVTLLAGSLTLAASSWALDHIDGLQRFIVLIGTGLGFGVLCVLLAIPVPGGGPDRRRDTAHLQAMRQALRDRGFRMYLAYTALARATMQSALIAFVPLFMKEEVGLAEGRILLLQVAGNAAGFVSGAAWGWMVDRHGGKPMGLWALGLLLLLPLSWLAMPRHHEWSFVAGLAIAVVAGIATAGWWISDQRLLYVSIVPPEKRTAYMALYYAWIGLVGGFGPLLAGPSLDFFQGLRGRVWIFSLDAYAPLFLASVLLLGAAMGLLASLRYQEQVGISPGSGLFRRRRGTRD